MVHFSCVALFALLVALQPRTVRVVGTQFLDVSTGAPVLMLGPNVVVKGPPPLSQAKRSPTSAVTALISGDTMCSTINDAECGKTGSCKTCKTFNRHDIDHVPRRNFIRLGVDPRRPLKTRISWLGSTLFSI